MVSSASFYDNITDHQGVNNRTLVPSKYATGPTNNWDLIWDLSVLRRLQAWGFNTVGEFSRYTMRPTSQNPSWGTLDGTPPIHLPYVDIFKPGRGSENNYNNYAPAPAKGFPTGIKLSVANLGTVYRTFFDSVDSFDPNFALWVDVDLKNDKIIEKDATGPNNDFFMGWVSDDSDNVGFTRCGPDFQSVRKGMLEGFPGSCAVSFGYATLIHSPTQAVGSKSKDDTLNADVSIRTSHFAPNPNLPVGEWK